MKKKDYEGFIVHNTSYDITFFAKQMQKLNGHAKMIVWDSMSMMVEGDPIEQYMWWRTKAGENIRINKMDTLHLKHTIGMLKRAPQTNRRKCIIRNMQEEYFKRLGPGGEVLFGKSK